MSDFSVRSDNVDVEQIMRQIRARIREKRGVDYTEEEIRELASVKLEKFIDPKGVRSNLLEEYRRVSTPEPPAPNYAFGEDTLYETHRGPIRWLRALFRPFLKLLFNPNPLIQALHIQSELNQKNAERNARREQLDALHYEVIHNLVVELTRTGVEVKSVKMRLESMASRLDFDERRARALEGVVQYRPGAVPPLQPPTGQDQPRRDQQQRRDQGGRPQGQGSEGSARRAAADAVAAATCAWRNRLPCRRIARSRLAQRIGQRWQRAARPPAPPPRTPETGEDRGPAFAGGGSSAGFGGTSPQDTGGQSPAASARQARGQKSLGVAGHADRRGFDQRPSRRTSSLDVRRCRNPGTTAVVRR